MSTAIVTADDKFKASETGLVVAPNVTYEEWAAYGRELARQYSSLQWRVGDWINFGEQRFGEMYAQALDDTHFSYGTLRNYASICARIPHSNRHPQLKFHQAKHVACLELGQQAKVVQYAVANNLTGDEILEVVQKVMGKKPQTRESIEGWVLHSYDTMDDEYVVKIRVDKAGLDYLQEVYTVTIKAK